MAARMTMRMTRAKAEVPMMAYKMIVCLETPASAGGPGDPPRPASGPVAALSAPSADMSSASERESDDRDDSAVHLTQEKQREKAAEL